MDRAGVRQKRALIAAYFVADHILLQFATTKYFVSSKAWYR